jgi:hypothetical protein
MARDLDQRMQAILANVTCSTFSTGAVHPSQLSHHFRGNTAVSSGRTHRIPVMNGRSSGHDGLPSQLNPFQFEAPVVRSQKELDAFGKLLIPFSYPF